MKSKVENNIIVITETDSTNNYANRQLASHQVAEGTVFLAYLQSKGRGQINNAWESEAGRNLTFSMVLKPDFLEITDQFMISKVVTLGVHKVLKEQVADLKIKWPNDIYAGNKKLGGILIENSIMMGRITNSVVGIGINVNQEIFKSDAPNPVSLKQLTGRDFDLLTLLNKLVTSIGEYYTQLSDEGFVRVNQLFEQEMYRMGTVHFYRCQEDVFRGKIIGVNSIGQLMIEDEQAKIRVFHFKEVEFII